MPRITARNAKNIQAEVLEKKLREDRMNGPQLIISFLINVTIGNTISNRRAFIEHFPSEEHGADPQMQSLFQLSAKTLLKIFNFTRYLDAVKMLLTSSILEEFCNFHLEFSPALMKFFAFHTEIQSKDVRFVIKQSEFSILIGTLHYTTIPYTADMEKPATELAEYTEMMFKNDSYNIEFCFRGKSRMKISENHLLLLGKLLPHHFAERALRTPTERPNTRLTLCFEYIDYDRCKLEVKSILLFFELYRAKIKRESKKLLPIKAAYPVTLDFFFTHPDVLLLLKNMQ